MTLAGAEHLGEGGGQGWALNSRTPLGVRAAWEVAWPERQVPWHSLPAGAGGAGPSRQRCVTDLAVALVANL